MKFLFSILLVLTFSFYGFAQNNVRARTDSLPTYQKLPIIPPFKIIQPDSTWYSKAQLPKRRPILILYFSPTCGHCQLETEDLISKLNDLKDLQIVMITSLPYEDMLEFANHYKISKFRSIKIGSDPQRLVTNFYQVKATPFSALYDRKGKFVKVYEEGIDWDELISLL